MCRYGITAGRPVDFALTFSGALWPQFGHVRRHVSSVRRNCQQWRQCLWSAQFKMGYIEHCWAKADQELRRGRRASCLSKNQYETMCYLYIIYTCWTCVLVTLPQGICMVGDMLITCGGTTGWQYNMDVHCLNTQTLHWQRLSPHDEKWHSQQLEPQAR